MLRTRTVLTAAGLGLVVQLLAPSPRALAAPRKCLESIHDPPLAILAPPLVDDADSRDWPALLRRFGFGVSGGVDTMFPPPTLDFAAVAPSEEPVDGAPHGPVRLLAAVGEPAAPVSSPPQASTWFSSIADSPEMLVIPEPGMSGLILGGSIFMFARRDTASPARTPRRRA